MDKYSFIEPPCVAFPVKKRSRIFQTAVLTLTGIAFLSCGLLANIGRFV